MNRREVLLALGVGSLAAFTDSLAASRYRDAEPPSLFLHACALDSVIGLLLATDIGRHQNYIEDLRKKNRFYIRLKHGSTNKYKVAFALDLLEYFFKAPDLTFIARVQGHSFQTDHGIQPNTNWVKVVGQQLRELINAGVARPGQKSFDHRYIDISSPGGIDRKKLTAYVLENTGGIAYLPNSIRRGFPLQTLPPGKKQPSKKRPSPDNLAQLAAFLTGAAGSLVLPPSPKFPSATNPAKARLRAWLINRLGSEGKTPKDLEKNLKFRILMRGAA